MHEIAIPAPRVETTITRFSQGRSSEKRPTARGPDADNESSDIRIKEGGPSESRLRPIGWWTSPTPSISLSRRRFRSLA
jgi:hypothetical protein